MFGDGPANGRKWMYLAAGVSSLGIGLLTYQTQLQRRREAIGISQILPQLHAAEEGEKKEVEGGRELKGWELRYKEFSSLVYKRQVYMTAQDFLESITQDEPRCR